jgi:hypothetical protein
LSFGNERSCSASGAGCHSAIGHSSRLRLDPENSYRNTVNRRGPDHGLVLVVPGDPARSFLLHKVMATHETLPECRGDATRCGNAMPPIRLDWAPAPTVEDVDTLRRWILAGAPP